MKFSFAKKRVGVYINDGQLTYSCQVDAGKEPTPELIAACQAARVAFWDIWDPKNKAERKALGEAVAKAPLAEQTGPWRCFHCDFVTSDENEARAHFGDYGEEEEPACRTWVDLSQDERFREYQSLLGQVNSLERENGRFREALRQYADDANWGGNTMWWPSDDGRKIAQDALKTED